MITDETLPHPDILPGLNTYPTKELIIKTVSEYYQVSIDDLYRKTRKSEIVEPRHIVISILKYALYITNRQISDEFRQTNASIVHARINVMNFYSTDKTYRQKVNEILEKLFYFEKDRAAILKRMLDPRMDKDSPRTWSFASKEEMRVAI